MWRYFVRDQRHLWKERTMENVANESWINHQSLSQCCSQRQDISELYLNEEWEIDTIQWVTKKVRFVRFVRFVQCEWCESKSNTREDQASKHWQLPQTRDEWIARVERNFYFEHLISIKEESSAKSIKSIKYLNSQSSKEFIKGWTLSFESISFWLNDRGKCFTIRSFKEIIPKRWWLRNHLREKHDKCVWKLIFLSKSINHCEDAFKNKKERKHKPAHCSSPKQTSFVRVVQRVRVWLLEQWFPVCCNFACMSHQRRLKKHTTTYNQRSSETETHGISIKFASLSIQQTEKRRKWVQFLIVECLFFSFLLEFDVWRVLDSSDFLSQNS